MNDDLARGSPPGRAALSIGMAALALLGLAGGATIAWLTGPDRSAVGGPVQSSSHQAGLAASPTEASREARPTTSSTAPATSTARVSSVALPTSSSARPPASGSAVPAPAAPAATPPPVRLPAPAPAPYRPAPAPVAPRVSAPAPPPAPAPAPPPVIDLGPRLPVVPQTPIAPKEIRIG